MIHHHQCLCLPFTLAYVYYEQMVRQTSAALLLPPGLDVVGSEQVPEYALAIAEADDNG
jgi:hypothetical protein